MLPLLFVAITLSSAQVPDLDLVPEHLPQALHTLQNLAHRDASHCIEQTSRFLAQTEGIQRDTLHYYALAPREPVLSFRSRQHTLGAQLLQAECWLQLGDYPQASHRLAEAVSLAARRREPVLLAQALFLTLRGHALLPSAPAERPAIFSRLQDLLATAPLRHHPLQVYTPLLQSHDLIARQQLLAASEQIALAEHWAHKANQPRLSAWVNAAEGDLLLAKRRPEQAEGAYLAARQYALRSHDEVLLGWLARGLERSASAMLQPAQARHYAQQAADYFHALGDKAQLADALLALGQHHLALQEDNLALVHLLNALDLPHPSPLPLTHAAINYELGRTYLRRGNMPLAQRYLEHARLLYTALAPTPRAIDTALRLAELHLNQAPADSAQAKSYASSALAQAEQQADTRRQQQARRLLANIAHQAGHVQEAEQQLAAAARLMPAPVVRPSSHRAAPFAYGQDNLLKALSQQLAQQKQINLRYRWTASAGALVLIALLYLWLLGRWRLQRSQHQQDKLAALSQTEVRSGLANWRQLLRHAPQEMNARQQSSERWFLSEQSARSFADKRVYLLFYVPFLNHVLSQYGYSRGQQITQAFAAHVQALQPEHSYLYDLHDGCLLLAVPQSAIKDLSQFANHWLEKIAAFEAGVALDKRVSLGIISHPFLPKTPAALTPDAVFDLCYLALAGASELARLHQAPAWLSLDAIDCQQAAFFTGDVWPKTLAAIAKGLVKVRTSHAKPAQLWQRIEQLYAQKSSS
ncbi:MAG: hypothetical protein ACRCYV_11465 [Aeromonas sp.]